MTVKRYRVHVYRCDFYRTSRCEKEHTLETRFTDTEHDANLVMRGKNWTVRDGLWRCPACRDAMQ